MYINQISIGHMPLYGAVDWFKKVLMMIPPEEISSAFIRCNKSVPSEGVEVDNWSLHLYTKDTRISFCDATSGFDGDFPRHITHKLLIMAGFDVPVEKIIKCTEDFELKK